MPTPPTENLYDLRGIYAMNFTLATTGGLGARLAALSDEELKASFAPADKTALGADILAVHAFRRNYTGGEFRALTLNMWVDIKDTAPMAAAGILRPQDTLGPAARDIAIAIGAAAGMAALIDMQSNMHELMTETHHMGALERLEPFIAVEEGAFTAQAYFTLDEKVWREEAGAEFSLESFLENMTGSTYNDDRQLGLDILSRRLIRCHNKVGIEFEANCTDGMALAVAAATAMRDYGHPNDANPEHAADAALEMLLWSNNTPTPVDMGIEYTARPAMGYPVRPFEEEPEPEPELDETFEP